MPFHHLGGMGQNIHFADANVPHTCWLSLDYVEGPFASSTSASAERSLEKSVRILH